MDTERSSHTLTTPGSHTVTIFDYITARELQAIARKGNKTTTDDQIDTGNEAMLIVVRSLDDSSDNLLDRILDLPFPDYAVITKAVQALIEPDPK